MRTADFDYELPPERIAQEPVSPRDAARLLVHRLGADETRHLRVRDLAELLAPGDLLVLNDTRVLAARLFVQRPSGARVELLFLEPVGEAGAWRAMARPARKLRAGEELRLEDGTLVLRAVRRLVDEGGRPGPEWIVAPLPGGCEIPELLERAGRVPLPPYIHRADDLDPRDELDRERYQTVYAREPGAVAAPTAGLHLTEELLARLAERGVERATVTLHVGPGTFRPVETEHMEEHRMHAERFHLPEETCAAVARCRARGGRVVCVGTTTVRVLESRASEDGALAPGSGSTDLFLLPGHRFRCVDALLTNFHLPRSTLLALVCAFGGTERVLALYREAVERGYRFYSYGDAMLLLP